MAVLKKISKLKLLLDTHVWIWLMSENESLLQNL
jgi:PIN domain nuclease of toxin-antitoxin system